MRVDFTSRKGAESSRPSHKDSKATSTTTMGQEGSRLGDYRSQAESLTTKAHAQFGGFRLMVGDPEDA